MATHQKTCPPELLHFCQSELQAIRAQIDQSLEHLSQGETLASLGAWDGLEARSALAGRTLQLIAKVYPEPTG